ncbi:HlyD family efflux transporter periplasmic adaptor subunit [Candidatus Gracilibacteria bacterium]|nr:HlyD family efflux transporter periplasmic adaptor subunit [Candidatus Gracilibacteria bacterium]NUJ99130.1 HlyD family efflux transporter periplasmic adaptor subunit [Candidatus Gracilibacteria bacterium]
MKKNIYIYLLLITLLLSSCGKQGDLSETGSGASDKKNFLIEVKKMGDLSQGAFLEKTGKISSTQEIKLASQASGRIAYIGVKEGDKVKSGQVILALKDNIVSYGLNLERAQNTLEKVQINYDSTQINLDKQIFDSEINLERLQNNLEALKKNTELDIQNAEDTIQDVNYGNLDSQSALQLQKIDNSITKAELDFQNKINADTETIEGFKTNLRNSYNSLQIFLDDTIEFGDKLFGVTNKYDDDAKKYESYLGGKDKNQKQTTEDNLRSLIQYRDGIFKKADFSDLSDEKILSLLNILNEGYELEKTYLNSFERTLTNSISSIGILSETEINAYVSTINAYQSQFQVNNASFLSFNNSASTFLRTYKASQESIAKQIDLLRQDRDIQKKTFESSQDKSQIGLDKITTSTSDAIKTFELQIKSARETLENAKKTKEVSLRALQNSINEAQIAYDSASKEYAKLTITAPIDGVIGDIFVDVGQDLAPGTPVVSILGNKKSEVEIAFKSDELSFISVGNKVNFDLSGREMTGSIYSITKVTDNSFNYKANVIFDTQLDTIGGVVSVKIPIKSSFSLLPLESVKIIGNNKGIISLYKDSKIQKQEIIFGKIYGNLVEYKKNIDGTALLKDDMIILNNVENFDEAKFNLKISN